MLEPSGRYWKRSAPVCAALPREARPTPARLTCQIGRRYPEYHRVIELKGPNTRSAAVHQLLPLLRRQSTVGTPNSIAPLPVVSRPGESHPRALAELYVNVSAHTAPIIQPPASPETASRGSTAPPARAVDRRDTLDDATPLLHRVSPTSSLVRVAPPLCLASGFSSLGVGPLDFSLHIEATGSHVPHKGLVQGHATFMPGAAQPSCRLPLDLSRVNDSPRFRHRPYAFDTLPVVHTLRLPAPYLTRSSRAVSVTLTTSALDRGSARRFEASPCRAAPRGLPSSLMQHGCS